MEKIIIDNRETSVFDYLSSIKYERNNLILGDFMIYYPNDKIICIERKTWIDLWASILDGRFREQRSRLIEWKNEHNYVIYLIEGVLEENSKICLNAVHRLSLVYKFSIWFTKNIQDSAEYIIWLCKQNNLFKESSSINDQITNLSHSIIKRKKDAKTSDNYLIALLQSIPGMSLDIVLQIIDNHKSLYEFIDFYKKDDGFIILSNKTYQTKTNKPRKLGKEKTKKIFEMLGIILPI
jgi:ERCC4-type nuclease